MFNARETEKKMDFEFGATVENIDEVISAVGRHIDGLADKHWTFDALLGLREALLNAVIHGCAKKPEKTVCCTVEVGPGAFNVTISDSGQGFDWRGRSTGEPDPLSLGGRGIYIIRRAYDHWEYNESGNKIFLSKLIPESGHGSDADPDQPTAPKEPGGLHD